MPNDVNIKITIINNNKILNHHMMFALQKKNFRTNTFLPFICTTPYKSPQYQVCKIIKLSTASLYKISGLLMSNHCEKSAFECFTLVSISRHRNIFINFTFVPFGFMMTTMHGTYVFVNTNALLKFPDAQKLIQEHITCSVLHSSNSYTK